MKLDTRYKASAARRRRCRAAIGLTTLLSLAAACPVVAAPTPSAPAPVVMSPGAPPTGSLAAPPIVPVDAPQNKLHLTPDQQTKANSIMGGFFQKRNAIIANKKQTQSQMQAAYAALGQATHAQMMAILTPQQKASLTQLQANKARYIAAANDAQTKALAYSKQLRASLTAPQKAKIDGIEKAAVAKLQAMVANPKLTIQQREQQSSTIRSNAQSTIKATLTPAQLAIYANVQRYIDQTGALRRLAQDNSV